MRGLGAQRVRLLSVSVLLVTSALYAPDSGIAGVWRLAPELSTPAPRASSENERPRERPSSGGHSGGHGGIVGMPGLPGGGGPSEKDMHRMRVIIDRLTDPPASLTIVRDGAKVIVKGDDGRSVSYTTDGRKEERLSGDGEFVSRAHFEGGTLVIAEDFGGGVKLTTHVAAVLSGDHRQLEVRLQATGLPKRPGPAGSRRPEDEGAPGRAPRGPLDSATHIYERVER
jgi:hypothetical protein